MTSGPQVWIVSPWPHRVVCSTCPTGRPADAWVSAATPPPTATETAAGEGYVATVRLS